MVEDNGIGITKEDAPYIFDRGFTVIIFVTVIIVLQEWDCILLKR